MRLSQAPKTLLTLAFPLTAVVAVAQTGTLSGKIINNLGQPVPNASVQFGTGKGVNSGTDGRFTMRLAPGKYTLTITSVNYAEKKMDVEVVQGQVAEIDVALDEKAARLDNVTVRGSSARRETTSALITFQKNTNTVASVISAEAIRRSPDKNTGEVLRRVPGASISEGRFLVVRGLIDRYNTALLNGVPLTSTEPDRRTFAFDMIPSGMIDNLIINKAFVPEMPADWAGGLVQVNTRDIPAKNFLQVQLGLGINTQAMSNDWFGYQGGRLDWLGLDDGTRAMPDNFTTKGAFDRGTQAQRNAVGLALKNQWTPTLAQLRPINNSFQINGGFNTSLLGKKLGGIFGVTYNRTNRFIKLENDQFAFNGNTITGIDFQFDDSKYQTDVLWGALGGLTLQLNGNNKISYKTLFNVNSSDYTLNRTGVENFGEAVKDSVRGNELQFQSNMFWSNQLIGEHNLPNLKAKLKWYGSFNILDGYTPDQRRILYRKVNTSPNRPYEMLVSNVLGQRSGNRFNQALNEYIYTAGGDLSRNFELFGRQQTVKAGYLLQIRDRLFDATPFSIGLIGSNPSLISQSPEQAFVAANFSDNFAPGKFFFNAITGSRFRYMANSILNAGYLQFDNQFGEKWRLVWGARIENYDQLVGSQRKSDLRHTNSRVQDILPGLNLTYKLDSRTNLRFSASQTVVRPEFRELATFEFYDFELNAAVQGTPSLLRTKISNLDFRYELYPSPGETFNVGVFYKNFQRPIEQVFVFGGGGSNNFFYINPQAANAYGAELELRKKLDFMGMPNFTFQTNLSYIYSRVTDDSLAASGLLRNRPMQGQSPYVINTALMYDNEKRGFNATLLFNQIGQRIFLVGNDQVPDIWEAPRPLMDLQVAKKVMKNRGELRLNVQDILNQRLYFYQNLNSQRSRQPNTDVTRFSRQFGTNISLTFAYNL